MVNCKFRECIKHYFLGIGEMKKIGITVFILLLFCTALSSCSFKTNKLTSRNTEMVAMLSDPVIRQDFRHLKSIAQNAAIYNQYGKKVFSEADIQKLDTMSAAIVNRLKHEYHLTSARYKVHTFIGKNEYNSCYEYYNFYHSHAMNQACDAFSHDFGSCALCNKYIQTIRSRRFSIIHAVWWNNERTMNLVDTFKLKNGDSVYMGLEISLD
jgi:hypothetical protein